MSAKTVWFTSFFHCSRKGPERASRGCGYVYAAFFEMGAVKVGSTVHPRVRFNSNSSWGLQHDFGKANVAVVPCGKAFRKIELEFHRIMRPLRVESHNSLDYGYQEVYKTKDRQINCLVRKYIEAGCCPIILKEIDARIELLEAAEPLKTIPA